MSATAESPPSVGRPRLHGLAGASMAATFGVLPVFLLSALAVLMRVELGFTEAQLGVAVSLFWAAAALCSVPSGRAAERLGDRRALVVAATGSGVVLSGMAAVRSFRGLLAWLVVGGVFATLSQLAANLRLAGAVPLHRQGLAFGIKQSAIPAATLVAGVAVPVIALTVGWRWVFVGGGLVALTTAAVQSRRTLRAAPRGARGVRRAAVGRRPLVVLGAAAAFGAGGATAMASFVLEYAVAVGIRPGPAGLVLAAGSAGAIVARVTMGWLADRRAGGNLLVVAAMLVVGSAAVATLPLVSGTTDVAVVTVVAYTVGWGWPGLFNLTVVRAHPQAPAAATAVTQVGTYAGGVAGPISFGALVTAFGYPTAWRSAAAALLTGALLMLGGRLLGRREWLPARRLEPERTA